MANTNEIDEEELENESDMKVRSFTSVVKSDAVEEDNVTEESEPEEEEDTEDEDEDDTVTEDKAKGIDKKKTRVSVPKDQKLDEETINRYVPKLAESLQQVQGSQMVSAQDMQTILKTSPNALKLMRKVADTHAYNMETYGSANAIEINNKRYKRKDITTLIWKKAKEIDASSERVVDPVEKVDAEIDTFTKRAGLYWGIPKEVAENMNFTYLKTLVTAVEYSILNGFH